MKKFLFILLTILSLKSFAKDKCDGLNKADYDACVAKYKADEAAKAADDAKKKATPTPSPSPSPAK